jgi:hypothetical protein
VNPGGMTDFCKVRRDGLLVGVMLEFLSGPPSLLTLSAHTAGVSTFSWV